MKIVLQRVLSASVEVDQKIVGNISKGLLVYLGVAKGDRAEDARFVAEKIANLRIFADENDKMNLCVKDIGSAVLLVSQFTLQGDCRKGRRPGFDNAAEPGIANDLYELAANMLREQAIPVETGIFAASMKVTSVNDGPVTFIIDSKE